jgi:hypothetical protein
MRTHGPTRVEALRLLDSDRGATVVLVAATLLVLFGFAAIAIDITGAQSERRQAQSAADFAALAALPAAVSCNPCSIADAADQGAEAAFAIAEANLPGRVLNWATCQDPNRPSEYTIVSGLSSCVSFTPGFDQSRVVLPTIAYATTFGRVLGANSIGVSALAEADQGTRASAKVIPYTIGGNETHACLYSNQAPQTVEPCDGPSDGNFGYLDIALFGDPDAGLPSTCTQGNGDSRVAINTAMGVDHILVTWEGGTPVNDHEACPNRSEDVDQLEVQPGTVQVWRSAITQGLIGTIGSPYSVEGRLRVSSGGVTVRNIQMDDTPLWSFLDSDYCDAVAGFDSNPLFSETVVDSEVEMMECIRLWRLEPVDSRPVLFSSNIKDYPRFVAVPVFASYPAQGASQPYNIERFAPLYLNKIYMQCNATSCGTVFAPNSGVTDGSAVEGFDGEMSCGSLTSDTIRCGFAGGGGVGSIAIEGLTAFNLNIEMFPEEIRDFFPGTSSTRALALIR